MGIPVICNGGVGDLDEIVSSTQSGILIEKFDNENYQIAIDKIDAILAMDKRIFQQTAEKYYSLEKGVEKYFEVYQKISSN